MYIPKGFRLKDLVYKACFVQNCTNLRTDKIYYIKDVTINKKPIGLKCILTLFMPYKQGLELRDHCQ